MVSWLRPLSPVTWTIASLYRLVLIYFSICSQCRMPSLGWSDRLTWTHYPICGNCNDCPCPLLIISWLPWCLQYWMTVHRHICQMSFIDIQCQSLSLLIIYCATNRNSAGWHGVICCMLPAPLHLTHDCICRLFERFESVPPRTAPFLFFVLK